MKQFARSLIRPRHAEIAAIRAERAVADGRIAALAEELAALKADHAAAVRRLARLEELLTEKGVL